MSNYTVCKTRLFAGVWEGSITASSGDPEADIEVSHLDQPIAHELINNNSGDEWLLRVPIDPVLISDGVQVFLIRDRSSGQVLNSFTIISGEPLEDDIRAEVELLRAELDMLKRAFRQHCLECTN